MPSPSSTMHRDPRADSQGQPPKHESSKRPASPGVNSASAVESTAIVNDEHARLLCPVMLLGRGQGILKEVNDVPSARVDRTHAPRIESDISSHIHRVSVE